MSTWVAILLRQCLPFFLLVLVTSVSVGRTWTSQDGRTIEADFVRINGEKVVLRWNGKVLQVPISSLSESDQQFARQAAVQKDSAADGENKAGGASSRSPAAFNGERAGRSNPFASASEGPRGILREWTDIQGRKIVAKFAGADEENVLLDRDGKIAKVPFQRLSTVDQHYVYKALNDMGMANNLPDVRSEGDPTGAIARDARERAAKESAEQPLAGGINNDTSGSTSPQPWGSRVWTYTSGRRITARLVTVQGMNVVLTFRNQPLDVPFLSLSDDDQQYVRDRLSERGQLALLAEIDGQIAAANQQPPSFTTPPASPPTFSSAPPSRPSFNHDPWAGSHQRMEEERQRRQQEAEQRRRKAQERLAQMERDRAERMAQLHTPPYSSPPPSSFADSRPPHFPSSQPSSYPPTPTRPSMGAPVEGYECESCHHQMRTVPKDNKCPGCGVVFGRIQNPDGTYSSTGERSFHFTFRSAKSMVALIGFLIAGAGALLRKLLD